MKDPNDNRFVQTRPMFPGSEAAASKDKLPVMLSRYSCEAWADESLHLGDIHMVEAIHACRAALEAEQEVPDAETTES